jgi:CubicO group peptidase (beta-lactamase class C family)
VDTGPLLDAARQDVDSGWLPSCQLAVARDGELIAFEAFGGATTATRFCVFSVTKPMVASVVWQLLGEGRLRTSDRVADLIPEFAKNDKESVTVEQLLLHTAGFPNAPMPPRDGSDAVRRTERLASWYLEWEPGSRFDYHAGSAHWVLAELVDRLTRRDFRDALQERVCAPLGLPRLLGLPAEEQRGMAQLVAVGAAVGREHEDYLFTYDRPDVVSAGVPGGGAVATAADIALFYQSLMDDRLGLWNPSVLEDATSNIRCTFPDPLLGVPVNRTIGLVVAGDDGQHAKRYASFGRQCSPRSFGHAGAHGQVAWADPATGLSFAYATNGIDADFRREGFRAYILSTLASQLL